MKMRGGGDGGTGVVYTVCNESRYLIVRNIPALGCIDDLVNLFRKYGAIEEYRVMDEVDSDPYEDVCWIKFANISNARFAKRKLDEYLFLGNLLRVMYAPEYESSVDVKEKLEERRCLILSKVKSSKSSNSRMLQLSNMALVNRGLIPTSGNQPSCIESNSASSEQCTTKISQPSMQRQYYGSVSIAEVAQSVRLRLDQISNVGKYETSITFPGDIVNMTSEGTDGRAEVIDKHCNKKCRLDNRRRI